MVEIRDFQPGVDTITLPELPTNWTWDIGSGVFSDTGKNYVSLGFANGSNASEEILRIGFDDYLSTLIDDKQDLIQNLLSSSNSGWAINDTIKEPKRTQTASLNGTIVNDVLIIDQHNTNPEVTLDGAMGDDILGLDQNAENLNGHYIFRGGLGNDFIQPGGTSSFVDGGDGFDRVGFNNLSQGINFTVDPNKMKSIEGVVGSKYADHLDFSDIEVNLEGLEEIVKYFSIKGNDGNDTLIGSNYDDILEGEQGIDSLSGGQGRDQLDGGAGADILIGGEDHDYYIVDNFGDTIIENLNEGIDIVQSSVSFTLSDNVERLDLQGSGTVGNGNSLDNVILGNQTLNSRLSGYDGNDRIAAGTQYTHDTLFGGNHHDTLYGESGHDKLYGESGNDSLDGASGQDTLFGGIGYDTLDGGKDNDTLYGEGENDKLYGRTGNDYLDGGSGQDTLYGEGNNDKLYGQTGNDYLDGGTGNDLLAGGDNDDTLYGQSGEDSLYGGNNSDHLYGGDNADTLFGGNNNDFLYGEDGVDDLRGGDGYD